VRFGKDQGDCVEELKSGTADKQNGEQTMTKREENDATGTWAEEARE